MAEPRNPARSRKAADRDSNAKNQVSGNAPAGGPVMRSADDTGRATAGDSSATSESRPTGTNEAQTDLLGAPATGPDQAEKALTGGREPKGDADHVYAGDGSWGDGRPDAPQEEAANDAVPASWRRAEQPQQQSASAAPDSTAAAHQQHGHVVHWPSGEHAVSPEEMSQMIAEAAYFRAERRGFHAGYEIEDWLGAEAEIRTRLRAIEKGTRFGTPGG